MTSKEVMKENSKEVSLADERKLLVISVEGEAKAAKEAKISLKEVQLMALEAEIFPERYLRNFGTVGFEGQYKLLNSTAGIVGAGGLGGYIIEFLARMGIGHLVVIDDDIFEANNLNRQLLSTESNLYVDKVETAPKRVKKINSGIDVTTHAVRLTEDNGEKLLSGCNVVVDALDNLSSRFALERIASSLGVPMVHGAIGGFIGQLMTIYPGDTGLSAIYPKKEDGGPDKLMEVTLGNPTATPPMVASWQSHECVKILAGIGVPLRNSLLYMDALEGMVEKIKLK